MKFLKLLPALIFLASLSFMLAYAVCIIRFKLMLIDQIVTKGMLYYAVSSLLTILFGMTVASGSIAVNYLNKSALTQMAIQQAISVAVLLMLITVLLLWLRDRFQQLIDRRFYREKYQLDKARIILLEAHRINPRYEPTILNLSVLEYNKGDFNRALYWLQLIKDYDSKYPSNLARIQEKL